MRIVAGNHKGRKLFIPKATRPTMELVREALFNIIPSKDAQFLELFAGSGAISLEAISRGASFVVMVESAREAFNVIKKNFEVIPATHYQVIPFDAFQWLKRNRPPVLFISPKTTFDYVYLDPPYFLKGVERILEVLHSSAYISTETILIYEHQGEMDPLVVSTINEKYDVLRMNKYGDTRLAFLQKK